MRSLVIAVCAALSARAAMAQATVIGEVVLREDGRPLEYATVGVLTQGRQFLANAQGRFGLGSLPAGELRLRFKRIGFVPRDTTLVLAPGDTVRLRVEMTRLLIQLPEMLVSGRCTNESPREPVPGFLAQLIGQVVENAERMVLLGQARPFEMRIEKLDGLLARDRTFNVTRGDTIVRTNLLPNPPYATKKVMFRLTSGPYKGAWGIMLPELPDIADTAFTNNHCFRYAGRAVVGTDSVVRIEFEPVPWLDTAYDLNGTLYLKIHGYQVVGSFTRLNRIGPDGTRAGLEEYFVDARFKEILPGVPVLDRWQLTNRYRTSRPSFVQRSRLLEVRWKDSTGTRIDIIGKPR